MLTQEYLKKILHYDPSTGDWTWLITVPGRKQGEPAGGRRPDGYGRIGINNKRYLMHRLAFLYMTGEFPEEVDHIDQNPRNDRWNNLRSVSHSQNMMNSSMQSNNKLGIKGVKKHVSSQGFIAYISKDKIIYEKYFRDLNKAIAWRAQKEEELFGSFAPKAVSTSETQDSHASSRGWK